MPSTDSVADIEKVNAFRGNRAPVPEGLSEDCLRIVSLEPGPRSLTVAWGDGHRSEFHYVWLRHGCFCPQCGDSGDGIRTTTVLSVPRDVAPASVRLAEDGGLEVTWPPDGHVSRYAGSWLRAYCYSDRERARRRRFRPKTWKADITKDFPTADYREVTASETRLLEMYELLRDYGIVMVSRVGDDPDATERLAKLVGPIHETTVYGHIYDVQVEPVSKLGAKTAMHQDPHHDDAFYYSPPGIDVFHCLLNTPGGGGESTYVDGFAIAEAIRAEAPEAFELLTTVPVAHNRRHPGEIDLRCFAPLIRLDWNGQLSGVRYFDRALAPLDAPPDLIEPLFEAIREYNKRMVSPEFKAEFFVPSGTGMLIDNQRCMHGRNAFDAHAGRRIRLCHVDRDEFHGRLRDLGGRLGRSDFDWILPPGAAPA